MRQKTVILTISLVAIMLTALFAAWHLITYTPYNPEFYVGVEVAYTNANASDVKAIVDKVRGYTNLIVIGSPEISLNQTALNEACDYIRDAGLHFIVLFTRRQAYTSYDPFVWMTEAQAKYGGLFLGVYRYDEPGGNQIDSGHEMLVTNATSYADATAKYTEYLGTIITYYLNYSGRVVTADYALHWFDYRCNYSTVLSEFASNNTREIAVAQCRGAARHFGRDWGAMLSWKYDEPPYIEPAAELYDDMILAFKNGAKYVVVFNYPKTDPYGILTEDHFKALKRFWTYIRENPRDYSSQNGKVAYVLPQYYGFGLRRPNDRIWGMFPSDDIAVKVWSDVNKMVKLYNFGFDIIFDEPGVVNQARNHYDRLIFWNETVS